MRGIITEIAGPGSFVTGETAMAGTGLETKNQREIQPSLVIECSRLIVSDIFLGLESLM